MISVGILAGGQSSRMGQNKAFLEVAGKTIIDRVIAQVAPLTDDLFINTNSPNLYHSLGLRLIPDVYPDKAALGGLYSVIQAARHPHVLIVACDMPFLNRELLQYLISLSSQADVVIPLIQSSQPETLHAIYSKSCLPAIEARLLKNRLKITGFFDKVSVHYVNRAKITQFDPHFYSFINVNTPPEWEKAKQLLLKY